MKEGKGRDCYDCALFVCDVQDKYRQTQRDTACMDMSYLTPGKKTRTSLTQLYPARFHFAACLEGSPAALSITLLLLVHPPALPTIPPALTWSPQLLAQEPVCKLLRVLISDEESRIGWVGPNDRHFHTSKQPTVPLLSQCLKCRGGAWEIRQWAEVESETSHCRAQWSMPMLFGLRGLLPWRTIASGSSASSRPHNTS